MQAEGVAANVKHFAANHQETNRMNLNEHIPERALHELYFPAFRACTEAGVATVMSAYNQINGVPCTENRSMLHDMLRGEWGFAGVVMSNWNTAQDTIGMILEQVHCAEVDREVLYGRLRNVKKR